ncbi:MAG: hypothetical protein QME89_12980, partial [Actinomycetota bacterium]|nr:hypothetical protein [Actinomycetota bacterium]
MPGGSSLRKKCPSCGVPLFIGRELRWGSDGVIHLARAPHNRMVLYESNIIDNLFRGIEELIGVSIEHIVIESRRREVRKYIEGVFPAWIRRPLVTLNERLSGMPGLKGLARAVRGPLGKALAGRVFEVGRVYGYGDSRPGPLWEEGDVHPWRSTVVHNPYSVLFFAAECLASVEAFEGKDHCVTYRELEEGVYLFEVQPGEHPVALRERLARKRYPFKPGELHYDLCPGCGVPREVERLNWDLDRGIITDTDSGRRMALFGPHAVDAVLQDLEAELGDEVPAAAVEAQRRYVKSRVAGENWRKRGTDFMHMAALRGLGYVARFEADTEHLSVTLHNACMPYLNVGMAQALYEIAMGRENSE